MVTPKTKRDPTRFYRTILFLTGEQLDTLKRLQERERARTPHRKVTLSEIVRARLSRGLRDAP